MSGWILKVFKNVNEPRAKDENNTNYVIMKDQDVTDTAVGPEM